jgi:hypothetical protein
MVISDLLNLYGRYHDACSEEVDIEMPLMREEVFGMGLSLAKECTVTLDPLFPREGGKYVTHTNAL